MANSSSEPIGSVQATHNYGQITLDVIAPDRIMASEEQLQQLTHYARRRMQNRVVPEVERLVEEDGAQIGEVSHAETNHDVQLPTAKVSAHVDCEVMAAVSEGTLMEVKRVIHRELIEPLNELFRRKSQRHEEAQFVQAVRSVMGGFKGRGA